MSDATFSPCRTWRYTLTREIQGQREIELRQGGSLGEVVYLPGREVPVRTVLFVMLNPSTADETKNDRTVERCERFAKLWGFDRLTVCNLFALQSTDPKALYAHPDPVGPENDQWITRSLRAADLVIAAWGNHGDHLGRGDAVLRRLAKRTEVHVLGLNKGGQPKHPLYLRSDTRPVTVAI